MFDPPAVVCPPCSAAPAGLIDPGCAVCGGHGTVQMHPAALSIYSPAVVGQAIDLSVSRAAEAGRALPDVMTELATALVVWEREPVQVIEERLVCARPVLVGRKRKRHRGR